MLHPWNMFVFGWITNNWCSLWYAGRGRGFVNTTTAEALPHDRRRYTDRTRTAAPLASAGIDLTVSNSRFNFPLPSNSTTTNNESQPKSLPVTRNRTTGSFNKTTIKWNENYKQKDMKKINWNEICDVLILNVCNICFILLMIERFEFFSLIRFLFVLLFSFFPLFFF